MLPTIVQSSELSRGEGKKEQGKGFDNFYFPLAFDIAVLAFFNSMHFGKSSVWFYLCGHNEKMAVSGSGPYSRLKALYSAPERAGLGSRTCSCNSVTHYGKEIQNWLLTILRPRYTERRSLEWTPPHFCMVFREPVLLLSQSSITFFNPSVRA